MNRITASTIGAAFICLASSACSSADGAVVPNEGAGNGAQATTDEPTDGAFFRFAQLASDAPPLDVCLRAHGDDPAAAFDMGPVLKTAGLAEGLSYGQVSAYFTVKPGVYDLRVVAPNADCSTALGNIPDRTGLAIDSGVRATLAGVGNLAQLYYTVTVRIDEAAASPGKAKIRFVHAAPAVPPLDVGVGVGDSFAPLFRHVAYGGIAAGDGVDANGYVETDALADQTLAARVAGGSRDALAVAGFSVPEGAVTSAFAIGVAGTGGQLLPGLLWCVDNDASKAPLASCLVSP